MAYSTTYPPGQVSLLGTKELVENRFPHITYVGRDGTKFYLAGPLAPTAGAQNGVVALSVKGLAPPFQHIDTAGARQDGTTWQDALYDPAEIDIQAEVSGVTAADTRAVIRSWLGAWDAKQRGRLHVFTPENGEWWAQVRMLKQFDDPLMHSYENIGKQRFTWAARNDDAFWSSFDSVDQFGMDLATITEKFPTVGTGISGWTQTYSGTGAGTCDVTSPGVCSWTPSGNGTHTVLNRAPVDSETDNQVITIKFQSFVPPFDLELSAYNDIWGRLDNNGNGIRCRVGTFGISLSSFVGGVGTQFWWEPLFIEALPGEEFTLLCGTSNGVRNFKVLRDGFTIINYTETGTNSKLGPGFRGWGFGMEAGPALLGGQMSPAAISEFSAGDNNTVTQSGFLKLINRGDQDAWPRYLCYGPGTFTFSDGPSPAASKVVFGPLLEDQIVLVTTLPRLRGVIDLSPSQPTQTLDQFQSIMEGLINFATNNNVPPLLQQFESLFGILPPQGVLYSLLQGRFTTPIPAKVEVLPPTLSQIAVSVVGGNAATQVVGAVTPLRRWPL